MTILVILAIVWWLSATTNDMTRSIKQAMLDSTRREQDAQRNQEWFAREMAALIDRR